MAKSREVLVCCLCLFFCAFELRVSFTCLGLSMIPLDIVDIVMQVLINRKPFLNSLRYASDNLQALLPDLRLAFWPSCSCRRQSQEHVQEPETHLCLFILSFACRFPCQVYS
jgi:hypothetical protein